MQRHERIRFFITEQCRSLDPTFRSYMFPKQVLVGPVILPHLERSSLTFRVNSQKKISFRIRLRGDEELGREPMNIGIPLTQVESISLKDHTGKHPDAAIVFLLSQKAVDRLVTFCHPLLDGIMDYSTRRTAKYLTVICRNDPLLYQNNPVLCRVVVLNNKFTFPFKTAKKHLMNDLPLMWDNLREEQVERRKKSGVHHDRELMTEMDDEGWDWLMGFLKVRWEHCPVGGFWLAKDEAAHKRAALIAPHRPWSVNTQLLHQTDFQRPESTPESPESSSDSTSNFEEQVFMDNNVMASEVMMQ